MGAKQSKRSVDISGKEAEGAGEVAAAGAGGEGRVEQLADADALKPQLNGDAHIHEQTENQKDVDSGTPENEKDAATEKEAKVNEDEKEAAPLTNGESEPKVENGDSTPTPEDGKKPKKEKVKKKWSLRSISFSRKDKPKQEKKQKEEEPKTNGETEKVPEEAAEVASEPAVAETAEEAKSESETKEEKTPETPVTEPITNGSSTPETPKDESPVVEEPVATSPAVDSPEPQPETLPEQLPVNGLSLEEPVKEIVKVEQNEESKEAPVADTTEIVPEIPVKKEVCVEQMPLIDSTPPPLPANPPPSSVASFAATTMAPESSDASLANTADNAIPPPISDPIAIDKLDELSPLSDNELTITPTVSNEFSSPLKQDSEEVSVYIAPIESETNPIPEEDTSKVETVKVESAVVEVSVINNETEIESKETSGHDMEIPAPSSDNLELPEEKNDISNGTEDLPSPPSPICDDIDVINEINDVNLDNTQVTIGETTDIVINSNHISDTENSTPSDNDIGSKYSEQNVKAKDSLGNLIETIECNGNIEDEKLTLQKESSEIIPPIDAKEIKNVECVRTATTPDDSLPPSLSEANESAPAAGVTSNDESESFPLPPSELCRSESEQSPAASPESPASPAPEPAADTPAHTPQDPLPVSDKLAELIPEVPDVPELKTEMLQETTSDVAVTN
ncbi:uncharacterized protein LOC111362874 isoform X2 [Spodoptera litura]|nr:uncharacterized protein LOC111362874 isoform X2 [Spodoptera litura]XP_022835401.1 uncharacterized protein LOC111362874 isoform X2 [Spodoptera litura]XP_022835402.1 uncharacterized protein LOC111362874 isoform X2 [Spodoptera litura]XP_022835403.1 uncharacterized protein LOC111362874 isoform X2 [Spodoptera litura]XP_022835404.1 uncharacterized protein LOC111362874 isoform X2 [Spodoptera litura]